MTWRAEPMTGTPMLQCLDYMAREVGAVAMYYFRLEGLEVSAKPADGTDVTIADLESNRRAIELTNAWPDKYAMAEEGGRPAEDGTWLHGMGFMIDPLDGTTAFAEGEEGWTVIVTLINGNNPLRAVIFDPCGNRMWAAEGGKTASLNGMPLPNIIGPNRIADARIAVCTWDGCPHNLIAVKETLEAQGVELAPVPSIGLVGGLWASGEIDGIVFAGEAAWETAAIQLMVEGLGGKITNIYGDPLRFCPRVLYDSGPYAGVPLFTTRGHIAAANWHLHRKLVDLVAAHN